MENCGFLQGGNSDQVQSSAGPGCPWMSPAFYPRCIAAYDVRVSRQRRGPIGGLLAALAGSAWARAALRYGVTALAILLFLLALRRSGERAGRQAERLEAREKADEVQRRMLEATTRRPRERGALVDRLRDGGF